ncbi:hypothetical protein AVEN_4884-1 [Araneus ventricosus]|uniref:Uncharacterized protein n=1 Tax=Araneus ventricosus TaxID=182803 RepID=A0A4Y2WGF2_ARAVE|nr:hypothetical protein AVEN_4884-1 [Araneus ventricosus]
MEISGEIRISAPMRDIVKILEFSSIFVLTPKSPNLLPNRSPRRGQACSPTAFPKNLRSDNHILVVAGEIASEIDADKKFESIPKHRVSRRKRESDYENEDEPRIDAQEKNKIEFFYHLVDTSFLFAAACLRTRNYKDSLSVE